jgi:LURP-one-related
MSMHHRWKVFRGDSDNDGDLLFTVKKSQMFQQKTELVVFLAGNMAEQSCDFKVKASWLERSCTFFLGDGTTIIAHVRTIYTISY